MTCPQQSQTTPFTPNEQRALSALRSRYGQDRDQFSQRERAHLHFVRWLYQTGRLDEARTGATEVRGG
jgi:hypothetical protein